MCDLLATYLEVPCVSEILSAESIKLNAGSSNIQSLFEYFYSYINPAEPKVVKISCGQLRALIEEKAIDLSLMSTQDIKIIECSRRDIHRQAVSNYIASITSQWTMYDKRSERKVDYDYNLILSNLHELQVREANARILLDSQSPGYAHIVYEDLIKDPVSIISQACNKIGVDCSYLDQANIKPRIYTKKPLGNEGLINLYTEIFKSDIRAAV